VVGSRGKQNGGPADLPKHFSENAGIDELIQLETLWVAVISAKNHKRQRRKRQSVTTKQEKSQTPKVLTSILTLLNLT